MKRNLEADVHIGLFFKKIASLPSIWTWKKSQKCFSLQIDSSDRQNQIKIEYKNNYQCLKLGRFAKKIR